ARDDGAGRSVDRHLARTRARDRGSRRLDRRQRDRRGAAARAGPAVARPDDRRRRATDPGERLVERPELRRAVEEFLYLEAELMDSHQYDRWMELWDEEALYWVPCNADQIDPERQVSLIYEHREQIEDRLFRLKGRHAHAQRPKSRLMRVVSNIRILAH